MQCCYDVGAVPVCFLLRVFIAHKQNNTPYHAHCQHRIERTTFAYTHKMSEKLKKQLNTKAYEKRRTTKKRRTNAPHPRGNAVHSDEFEIGYRLKQLREALGYTQTGIAEAIGSKLRSWQEYERGSRIPGSQVIAGLVKLGVNANWVLVGEGPMLSKQASDEEKAKIDAEIEAVEKELSRFELPVSQDDVLKSPELLYIKQRVMQIQKNPAATDPQRTRADLILSLAFQDEEAGVRLEQKKRDLSERLRAARESYEEVIKAVGYQPPPAFAEALKTAIFYGLNVERAALLLEAFKHEVSKT